MSHWVPHWPFAQTWPLPQAVPSERGLSAEVLALGWHVSQGLALIELPDAKKAPPTTQPDAHAPVLQTSPEPQLAPLARLVHALVLTAGWQL